MTIPATSQKKAASGSDCEDDGGSSAGSSSGVVVGKDDGKTSSEDCVRFDGEGETDSAGHARHAHSQEKNGIQRRSPSDVDSGRVSGTARRSW